MGSRVVTIGTFDGVHLGHQRVLDAARRASGSEGPSLAYAFDAPPRASDGLGLLLVPPGTKRVLLARWVDLIVDADVPRVRPLTPRAFVRDVLAGELEARTVVVGESFRFGAERAGDVRTLGVLAGEAGITVEVVPALLLNGEPVSSTRIRSLLAAGDVEQAALLLGRPPLLRGRVEPGDAIGRTLGFPTANLAIDPRVLVPQHGVYLSRAFVAGARSLALTYVGRRPTLGGSSVRCEVHLLEPPQRGLVGEIAEVHLYRLLREDVRFTSLAALRSQMELDLVAARRDAGRFPDAADPDPVGG